MQTLDDFMVWYEQYQTWVEQEHPRGVLKLEISRLTEEELHASKEVEEYNAKVERLREKVADTLLADATLDELNALTDSLHSLETWKKELTSLRRKLTRQKNKLEALGEDDETPLRERGKRVAERLFKNVKLERMRIEDDALAMYTAPLTCSPYEEKHRDEPFQEPFQHDGGVIGRYRIRLFTDGSLSFELLDKYSNSYPHWAISGTTACFGAYQDTVVQLKKSGNIPRLFDTLVRFLEDSGEDDVYCCKSNFLSGLSERDWRDDYSPRPQVGDQVKVVNKEFTFTEIEPEGFEDEALANAFDVNTPDWEPAIVPEDGSIGVLELKTVYAGHEVYIIRIDQRQHVMTREGIISATEKPHETYLAI